MIKTVLFIIIGLILIIALVYFFLPRERNEEEVCYNAGTYSTKLVLGEDNYVLINVTVTKSRISSIEMTELTEVQEVFYPTLKPTLEKLSMEIVRNQSLDVELDENEMTGRILLNGIAMALDKAKINR